MDVWVSRDQAATWICLASQAKLPGNYYLFQESARKDIPICLFLFLFFVLQNITVYLPVLRITAQTSNMRTRISSALTKGSAFACVA